MSLSDLRSDTVTRPDDARRAAMAAADVGDDVYGEDPTVNRLEDEVAELLGHEAGLFCPSGTLANQLGLRLLVRPGQELLCDSEAHIVRAEMGAAAALSGITTRTWESTRGLLNADRVTALMRPNMGGYMVSTSAVAVENTHNFGGGVVQPFNEIVALRAATAAVGVAMHLDGARLWNAHIASGVALDTYASHFDTVSVCFSKGLGAPVGSMLVAGGERIAEGRQWRKRYGAGMRQAGILAAGALHALHHNLSRLADDHRRAAHLAATCAAVAPSVIDPRHVETNIVGLDLSQVPIDGPTLVARCRADGVLCRALGRNYVRLVTHLDVDDAAVERAAAVLREHLVRC